MGEVVPPDGRVPDVEVCGGMAVEIPGREEIPPWLCLRSGELLVEPDLGQAVDVHKALPSARLDPTPYRAALLAVQLDPGAVSEVLDGLGESEVVSLLDEGDDVIALTAARAVSVTELGVDAEGGSAPVVKGA